MQEFPVQNLQVHTQHSTFKKKLKNRRRHLDIKQPGNCQVLFLEPIGHQRCRFDIKHPEKKVTTYLNINRHSRHLDIKHLGPCSIFSTNSRRRHLDIKQPENVYCLYKTPIVIFAILTSNSQKKVIVCIKPQLSPSPS